MAKYRFKTREEFKKEFGPDWRSKVRKTWSPDMDYLLGVPVPLDEYGKEFSGCNTIKRKDDECGVWAISNDMVVVVSDTWPVLKSKIVKLNQSF